MVVDLHFVAVDDHGRILIWITLHGTHIEEWLPVDGRADLRRVRGSPRRNSMSSVSTTIGSPLEHWAVRDDLRVLEAIDQ